MNIPVFTVKGETIPATWEYAILALAGKGGGYEGIEAPSQNERDGDPPSLDCTMIMVVQDPMREPRIHRSFPDSLEGLFAYADEVVHGVADVLVKPGGWSYSYHQRLTEYESCTRHVRVNQFEEILDKLQACGHTRRANAITWDPFMDFDIDDPPCLQRIWLRLLPDNDGRLTLNMNTHWRSRNALRAAFMNLFAVSELQRYFADELEKRMGEQVICGRLVDVSDSFHLEGVYRTGDPSEVDKFLHGLKSRSFDERTWTVEQARKLCK
jgi:thymidylate synthase